MMPTIGAMLMFAGLCFLCAGLVNFSHRVSRHKKQPQPSHEISIPVQALYFVEREQGRGPDEYC